MTITAEVVADFFAKPSIPLAGDMLWGFFFTGHERAPLERMKPVVEALGYRYVGLLEPDPAGDDKTLFFLHIERVETHTSKSLWARCQELHALATAHGLETFDGFDVGAADQFPTRCQATPGTDPVTTLKLTLPSVQ